MSRPNSASRKITFETELFGASVGDIKGQVFGFGGDAVTYRFSYVTKFALGPFPEVDSFLLKSNRWPAFDEVSYEQRLGELSYCDSYGICVSNDLGGGGVFVQYCPHCFADNVGNMSGDY